MLYKSAAKLAESGRKSPGKAAACTVIVLCLMATLGYIRSSHNKLDHVLIIDSGSTGTRIIAYTWEKRKDMLPIVSAVAPNTVKHKVPRKAAGDVRAYDRVETEPGLDRFADDAAGLWTDALQPLLAWAEAVVPPRQWAATPLFLFGTAGLRVLSPEQQSKLLAAVKHALHLSHFRFEEDWARVISGVDEGIYGWVALNYLTGNFAFAAPQTESSQPGQQSRQSSATVGAVDLGGSSLEVTFVPDDPQSSEAQVNLTILGSQYNLYSHVHHSFGLNDAFDRSVAHLLTTQQEFAANAVADVLEDSVHQTPLGQEDIANNAEQGAAADNQGRHRQLSVSQLDLVHHSHNRKPLQDRVLVEHPCLHEGYDREYTWVAHGAHVAPLPEVQLLGRPDWKRCQALAAEVVGASKSGRCDSESCALGVPQPHTSHKMYALTGFFVVYKFFGLPSTASLADVEAAGRDFCATPWSAVAATRAAEIHVDRYCFRVPYVLQLLREGLGMQESQIKIGTGNEGWTLGAALSEGPKALSASSEPLLTAQRIHGGGRTLSGQVLVAVVAFALLSATLLGYIWHLQKPSNHSSASLSELDIDEGSNTARGHTRDITSPFQKAMSTRTARGASSSNLQLHANLDRSESLAGKTSPPPVRQDSTELPHLASANRVSSIAGHRKRQMSISSLENFDALK